MSRYYINEDQLSELEEELLLTGHGDLIKKIIETIRNNQVLSSDKPLPRQHREAVGLSFYEALGATEPWAIANSTGTLLALLGVSVEDAGNDRTERAIIDRQKTQWDAAMTAYGTPNNDREKFHAAWLCQKILADLGRMPYRYGSVPASGYKLTPAGGTK